MNTARRKQLKQAAELLSQAQAIIESVRDDEQYEYHNMPESLQYSERGERITAETTDSEIYDYFDCDYYDSEDTDFARRAAYNILTSQL